MFNTRDIEMKLEESERKYFALLNIPIQPIAIYNFEHKILYANPSLTYMLGAKDNKEIIGRYIFDFIHPDYQDIVRLRTNKVFMNQELDFMEYKLISVNRKDVDFISKIVKTDYHNEEAVLVIGSNITKNKKIEKKLAENEERLRSLFVNNPDAVFALNLEGEFISLNSSCEKITGYNEDELLSMKFNTLVDIDDLERVLQHHYMARNNNPQIYECKLKRKDGTTIDLSIKSFPIIVNDEIIGTYGIAKDITSQKNAERQIKQMAFYDSLTDLPNRNYFSYYLNEILNSYKDKISAILFIDLDRFKEINDTMGHSYGDKALKEIARKLTQCVGKE